jgi:NAD(P)H-dependent flavin oxidoreductase YrpB (nitropropane dioxygenase family)
MDGSLLRTPLCTRLGIELPIVQAPIGSGATPELVAAVAGAGALGMLAMSWTEPDIIRSEMQRTSALTPRPFGVNFVLEWDQRQRLEICLEEGARIVSYFWTALAPGSPYIDEAHAAGATVLLTVGSADEAKRAVDAGVDVVVAQGFDAGGHVWGSVGTMSLVPAVVDAVAPTPVIAAGGIGDGRGLAAVLALGAQAAWMGTRFVVADEAGTHPEYRDRIVRATETDAVWSQDVFDGGWKDAPVRTLDNSTLRNWRDAGSPAPGSRPGEGDVIGHWSDDGEAIERYGADLPGSEASGDLEAMANYAGQSAGVVRTRGSAADIVRDVAADADRILRTLSR